MPKKSECLLTKEEFCEYINFIKDRVEAEDKINDLFTEEFSDSIKTLEFNDEYEGSDNIIRIYYCEKDSYMFIQCYYKDPSGNKVDMWEVGILDRNNIVDFIVTLSKFAEDIMEK